MFCCLSFEADKSLNQRDLQMMKAFADIAAFEISRDLNAVQDAKQKSSASQPRWRNGSFPPFTSLYSAWKTIAGRIRVPDALLGPAARSPDVWFKEAAEVGLGLELEIAALEVALSGCPRCAMKLISHSTPRRRPWSPESSAMSSPRCPPERIVLEVTEHALVADTGH
jgi:hypothetical protein